MFGVVILYKSYAKFHYAESYYSKCCYGLCLGTIVEPFISPEVSLLNI
jgi:hypothetical protein